MQKWIVSFLLAGGVLLLLSFVKMDWARAQHASTTRAAVPESAPIPPAQIPQYIRDAVNAADRPATDKSLDAGRQPEPLLAFWGFSQE